MPHPLDAVPVLVSPEVADLRVLSVCFRWNDRPNPVDQQLLTQEITVVTFVGEEKPWFSDRYRQQIGNGIVIGSLTARQDKAERTSLTLCAGMDFCRKAAA